jgi:hypothetical protein
MSAFSGRAGRLAALGESQKADEIYRLIAGSNAVGQAQSLGALYGAQPQQLSALQGGYDAATGYYNQARGESAPYLPGAYASWNQMLDAAGVNGPGGHDAAVANFRASPGYDWQKQQATDEANRGAAAGGQLLSGNTIAAIQDRASHLADQEYGNYYNRLQGVSDRGQQAVGQVAGIDQALGGLAYGYGGDVSNVHGGVAKGAADIYGNTARLNAAALGNLGNQQITAQGNAQAAGDRAGANTLNLGIAGLNAAATIAGGNPGIQKKISSYLG